MQENEVSYYQFRKHLDYQIFLRFEDAELELEFDQALKTLGFDKLDGEKLGELGFSRNKTKILKISRASARVARQISETNPMGGNSQLESLSQMSGYDIYRLKGIGMMVKSSTGAMWELGVADTSDVASLRCLLTRYLSFAFDATDVEVVGLWGVQVAEGIVVMNPKKADFESVFIDLEKKIVLGYNKEAVIENELEIIRLDELAHIQMKKMSQEELFGFLSVSTCYLSHRGLNQKREKALYQVLKMSSGVIYPEANFAPRAQVDKAA